MGESDIMTITGKIVMLFHLMEECNVIVITFSQVMTWSFQILGEKLWYHS